MTRLLSPGGSNHHTDGLLFRAGDGRGRGRCSRRDLQRPTGPGLPVAGRHIVAADGKFELIVLTGKPSVRPRPIASAGKQSPPGGVMKVVISVEGRLIFLTDLPLKTRAGRRKCGQ